MLVNPGRTLDVNLIRFLNAFGGRIPVYSVFDDDISFRCQYSQRNGLYSKIAGGSDIDKHQEAVHVGNCSRGPGCGFFKRQFVPLQETGCFHKDQFIDAVRTAFPQKGGVVIHWIGRGFFNKPGPGIGVPVVDNDNRPEANRFKTSGIQKRCIQAGGQPTGEDVFRKTNPLALLGKRCRRIGIDNYFVCNGFINSRNLHFDPVDIFLLIAVKGGISCPFLQLFCRPLQDRADGRMVRQDESGKQFGRVVHSFPKIVG